MPARFGAKARASIRGVSAIRTRHMYSSTVASNAWPAAAESISASSRAVADFDLPMRGLRFWWGS